MVLKHDIKFTSLLGLSIFITYHTERCFQIIASVSSSQKATIFHTNTYGAETHTHTHRVHTVQTHTHIHRHIHTSADTHIIHTCTALTRTHLTCMLYIGVWFSDSIFTENNLIEFQLIDQKDVSDVSEILPKVSMVIYIRGAALTSIYSNNVNNILKPYINFNKITLKHFKTHTHTCIYIYIYIVCKTIYVLSVKQYMCLM